MISTRYKCIYIRISKAASNSIQHSFRYPEGIWNDFTARLFEHGEFHSRHHDMQYYYREYPYEFATYFKFSFVRNPWSRIYSAYCYLRYKLNHECAQCNFLDWLKKCEEYKNTPEAYLFARNRYYFIRHITNQMDWLCVNGKLETQFIGRYERIKDDFYHLCNQRNWRIELPILNSNNNLKQYHSYYDDKHVDMVSKWHEKDINYFGYTFEP